MKLFFLLIISFVSVAQAKYECRANYDSLQIPHQITNSEEEFYYCFGFHHGQDRAWQMDYFRRLAQGRNAEILGFEHLKSDLLMRLLNLPSLAERIWNELPDEKKKVLENYTKGVNAGFIQGKKSKEFLDKNYAPEEWHPKDSLIVLLLQSFDQCRKTFLKDHDEERAKEDHGEKAASLFDVDNIPWENTILKDGEYQKKSYAKKITSSNAYRKYKIWAQFPTVFGEESGSNNWVISKSKSKTGNAILANDPHLDLKTPMFWYWMHLKSPQAEVIGGSLPGVPVVVSGTNGKVSWGLTNSYFNTADVVFLKDQKEEFIETIRPLVWIKFGFIKLPFFFKSFERTKHGHPIVPLELKSDNKMVLRWTGFNLKGPDVAPMLNLYHAKNVKEIDDILQSMGIPSWNFVFADTKGEIGFRVVGKLYRSSDKDDFGIETISQEELLKEEFLDANEVPHILNPKRDYIYTANNRHWPSDSQFYGGRGYALSFRGYRVDELINGKQDIDSFKKIQCDRQAVDARFFRDRIVKYIDIPVLKNWDFGTEDDSKAVPVYRRLMDLMMERWKVTEYGLYRMLENLDKDRQNELAQIYKEALSEINGRTWGEIHRINFPHLSKNTHWVFSPNIAGIGDTASVDPGTAKWNTAHKIYEQYGGASMRMIIEMKERPEILLILPGINRTYTDHSSNSPWEEWKNCRYRKVKY